MPDDRAGVGEEGFNMCDALRRGNVWRRAAIIVIRQILDLVDTEYRIRAKKRNGAFDFVAMLVRLGLGDLVRIEHHRSALALADVTAQFERLLERHPYRRREAARHGLRPE